MGFAIAEGATRVLPGGVVASVLTPERRGSIGVGAYVVEQGRSMPEPHRPR